MAPPSWSFRLSMTRTALPSPFGRLSGSTRSTLGVIRMSLLSSLHDPPPQGFELLEIAAEELFL